MKRNNLLIIIVICMFVVNVKADMGPPIIARHEVMVTNKDGAKCYNSGSKKDIVIPYGKTLTIDTDVINGYIHVYYDDISCDVKSSDISSKTQKFSLDDKSVTKITPVRAIILSKTGLNMRKGPAVTYAKIMTVPNNALVTLLYQSGTFWYYCEYNGTSGWITGMNGYFGYDGKETLISHNAMKIYSSYDKKAVIGKIPANTEITDYVNLVIRSEFDIAHYVSYNGTIGYVEDMMYQTTEQGKIKLLKDYEVTNEDGKLEKKITPQELEYNMISRYGALYLPEKKLVLGFNDDEIEYLKKVDVKVKDKGYLGEGIFGEEKVSKLENKEEVKEEIKDNVVNKTNTKDIIIICLLAGIFITLTALIVIKLINNKKNKQLTNKNEQDEYNNKEV